MWEKTGQNYDEIINKAARSQQSGKEFTDLAVRVVHRAAATMTHQLASQDLAAAALLTVGLEKRISNNPEKISLASCITAGNMKYFFGTP